MTFQLAPVGKSAAAILDELTRDLPVGGSRKVDRGFGFMAVHVECLHETKLGSLFSVAHYFESNGDLVADPDVVFLRRPEGWAPISYRDSIAHCVVARLLDDGLVEANERGQRVLVRFCQVWLMNIRTQHGVTVRSAR